MSDYDRIKRRNPATWHVTQMRPHAALACALISATAALESVPADAFQSVARGRVAVVDNFLARDVVAALRGDAEELWDAGLYSVATGVLRRPFSYPVTTAPCDHFRTPPTRRRRDPRNNAGADARHEAQAEERALRPARERVARLRNR